MNFIRIENKLINLSLVTHIKWFFSNDVTFYFVNDDSLVFHLDDMTYSNLFVELQKYTNFDLSSEIC